MLYLFRKEIGLVIGLVLLVSTAYAQRNFGGANFQRFNPKPYYFGLAFGYNNSNFKIKHSAELTRSDTFLVAEGINSPGFSVNLIGNLKFGQYMDFRILPGFAFADRTIMYVPKENTIDQPFIKEVVESVFVEFPIQFRYKSDPYKNIRFFFSGGFKYTFDVSSSSRNEQNDNLIKITPHDFSAEVGAGIQIFFPYFIFSPEIRYSHGINSIHIENRSIERSKILDKLISRSLSIRLNFEG